MNTVKRSGLPARTDEAALVDRCAAVAQGLAARAMDVRDANVFRVAGMVVGQRHRIEAGRLLRASDDYFSARPADRLPAAEVVRRGWVASLPRLRELLDARFGR
jgi:hypothetical protein